MRLIKFISNQRLWVRFLVYGIFWFSLGLLFFKVLRKWYLIEYFYEEGIYYLTVFELKLSKLILEALGYQVEILGKVVKIKGAYGVHLDKGCLGRNILLLFVGFILSYPGNVKSKIWYIPLGLFIILFLNVLRIVALAIIDSCCRAYLDFNHHFTFSVIVYTVIFILWVIWIKKYGAKK